MGNSTQQSESDGGTPSPERLGSACTYAMPGGVESGVCGFWQATCRKCGRPIVRVHGFKRWRHVKQNNRI
jgi:hypothetical protein